MNHHDNRVLAEFRRRLPDKLKNNLKRIIVYGSRARGDAAEDSDLDVAVLVKEKNSKIEKELEDIAYDVMWEFDFNPIISLKVFSHSRFQDAIDQGFSFYRHVMKEGVAV